jgi:hypothetical protein
MISIACGHTLKKAIFEHLCAEMITDRTAKFPKRLLHATKWRRLVGIAASNGLWPGGPNRVTRPIFCEHAELKTHEKGYGHRQNSEIAIYFDVDLIAQDIEEGIQRHGFTRNGVSMLKDEVLISRMERIESYADNGLTLYKKTGKPITWSRCEPCGMLLPSGTHICWNVSCQHPKTEQGWNDVMRLYSMAGNNEAMRNLFSHKGQKVSNSQIKRDAAAARNEDPRGSQGDGQAHVSWTRKQMDRAKRALKISHPGLADPAHPGQWLVEPHSRKFRSHVERFNVDAVYREQCLASDPQFSTDGHLWFHGRDEATGTYMYLDAVELVANASRNPNDEDPRGSVHRSANRGMYRGVAPKSNPSSRKGKGDRKGASKSSSSSSWER